MLRLSLLLLALVPAVASGATPSAHASKGCSLSSAEEGGVKASTFGPTYVRDLSAKGTSCKKAKGVVKAFHACRYKQGKSGHCASKVKGYSCKESRTSSPVQFDSTVTCSKGSKRVKHKYTQNT